MQRTCTESAEFRAWQRAVAVIRWKAKRSPKSPPPPEEEDYGDGWFPSDGPWNRICRWCKKRCYSRQPAVVPEALYAPPRYKEVREC